MVNIKVVYKDTLRRFAIPDDSSWSDLESKIRNLFSISPKTEISLSYTDEDNDIITLSTDVEFKEILSWKAGGTIKFNLTAIETNGDVSTDQFTSSQQVNYENNGETDSINVGSKWGLERVVSVAQSENVSNSEVSIVLDCDENAENLESTQMQVDEPSVDNSSTKQQSSTLNSGKNAIYEDDDLYVTEENNGNQASETSTQQQNDDRSCYLEHLDQFHKLIDQSQDILVKHPQILETVNQIMKEIIRTVPVNTEDFSQWINSFKPPTLTNSRLSTSTTTNTYSSQSGRQEQSGRQDTASSESTSFLNSPSPNPYIPPMRSVADFAPTGFSHFTAQRNSPRFPHPVSNPIFNTRAPTFSSQNISSTNVRTGSYSSGRSFVDITTTNPFPFSNNPFGPHGTRNNAFRGFNFDPMVPQNGTRTTSEITTNVSSTNPFSTPNFFRNRSSVISRTSNSFGTPNFTVGSTATPISRNPGTTPIEVDDDRPLNEKKVKLFEMGFFDEEKNENLLRECSGEMDVVIDRLLSVDGRNMSSTNK